LKGRRGEVPAEKGRVIGVELALKHVKRFREEVAGPTAGVWVPLV